MFGTAVTITLAIALKMMPALTKKPPQAILCKVSYHTWITNKRCHSDNKDTRERNFYK